MSRCFNLVVMFECEHDKALVEIAEDHYQRLLQSIGVCNEARWYLDDLRQRTCTDNGPKGAMSTWGKVCNHTNLELFIENLKPFFLDLYGFHPVSGLGEHDKIVILYEEEQSEAAGCYTIELCYDTKSELIVAHTERLPFSWKKYYT